MLCHQSKDMTLKQIQSRDTIPWIFLKRKSPNSASCEFFQVPVEALLKLDNLEEYDERKIHSDSLICFLNQLQFIRLKAKNHILFSVTITWTTAMLLTLVVRWRRHSDQILTLQIFVDLHKIYFHSFQEPTNQ